jgi:hypothetical protein
MSKAIAEGKGRNGSENGSAAAHVSCLIDL